jgi:spermidine synthase
MGGTIPILSQALASTLNDATRFHALVYALNTAGAFIGALAAGFFLIPWIGLDPTVRWMGVINLTAGVAFMSLERAGKPTVAPAPEKEATPDLRGFFWFGAAALLAGFAMMAIQTVLIRLGGMALGASQFTFSMVVAVFVLCIALGSSAVSLVQRIPTGTVVFVQWMLVILLFALYPQLENLSYFAHAVRTLFLTQSFSFYPFYLMCFVLLLALLAVPVGLSGALLPLLFHELRREMGQLGSIAGRLYAWNTLGSLLGALLGGYLLLFWLDLHHVYRIAVFALALTAVLLAIRLFSFGSAIACVVALFVAGLVAVQLDAWRPERTASGLFRERNELPETYAGADAFFATYHRKIKTIFFDDDPNSTVTVVHFDDRSSPAGYRRSLYTNGKPDTQVPTELPTVVSLALLPCLMAERCERAFVVGLGTGTTAGEFAQLEGMQEVVTAEVSSGVIDAQTKFGFANHNVWRDPKVEIRRSDAYRALMRDDTHYDVISSEPSNPWVTGIENLYSVEFLEAAKMRLRPGGVYAQWLQGYEISPETFQIVLRTFASVFDNISVWAAYSGDLILICNDGDPAPLFDIARIEERAARPSYAAALQRAGYHGLPVLLARELLPVGVVSAGVAEGPRQSLFHPILNHAATRDFFLNAKVTLRASPEHDEAILSHRNSLLRRYAERRAKGMDDADFAALVDDACASSQPRDCVAFLAWWGSTTPGSEALAQRKRQALQNGGNPEEIDLVETLYGGRGLEDSVPADKVASLARAYEAYFHPASPFQQGILASALERCQDGGSGRCEELRATAEESFGKIARTEVSD